MLLPITRHTHDPVEIFTALYNTRKSELEAERRKQQELMDKAELDWFRYDNGTSVSQRYDVSLGG
jgi:hypothetical protein